MNVDLPNATTSEVASLSIDGERFEVLEVRGFERISTPFRYRIRTVRSPEGADPRAVIGRVANLELSDPAGRVRRVKGVVAEAEARILDVQRLHLDVDVRPFAHSMSLARGAHAFRAKSVVEVASALLDRTGVPHRLELHHEYEPRPYWAQPAETDWCYLARILAEEGIYFWFDHHRESVLVLADVSTEAPEIEDGAAIPFASSSDLLSRGEAVSAIGTSARLTPTRFSLRSYDPARPRLELAASAGDDGLEVYDAPGAGPVTPDGCDARVRRLLEASAAARMEVAGRSNSLRLAPARMVEITGHPLPQLEGRWLLTSVRTVIRQRHRNTSSDTSAHDCVFTAIPADLPFRPAIPNRARPAAAERMGLSHEPLRNGDAPDLDGVDDSQTDVVVEDQTTEEPPQAPGIQLGVIVGAGEIDVDASGAVLVKGLWDRAREAPENGVRVRAVQRNAAGSLQLPRVGWKVITLSQEGNLAAPLVFKRMMDATHPPAYPLPAHATRVVYKTPTSPGGESHNEIHFEDAAGAEEMHLEASRDMSWLVRRDKNEHILRHHRREVGRHHEIHVTDRWSEGVGRDQICRTEGDERLTASKGNTKSVGRDETSYLRGDRQLRVGTNHSTAVHESRLLEVTENLGEVAVGPIGTACSDFELVVGGSSARLVGGQITNIVGRHATETVSGNKTDISAKDRTVAVGELVTERIAGSCGIFARDRYTEEGRRTLNLQAEKEASWAAREVYIQAQEKIEIRCGESKICLSRDCVEVEGVRFQVKGKKTTIHSTKFRGH
jgi:type VI secretion system secreted protein VgrG